MLKRSLLFLSLSGITYLTWNYFIQLRPVSEDEVIWVWLYAEAKDPKHKFAYTYQSWIGTELKYFLAEGLSIYPI